MPAYSRSAIRSRRSCAAAARPAPAPPGTLAGAFADAARSVGTVALETGDAPVLYTDGVFDTGGRDGRLGGGAAARPARREPAPGRGCLVRHVDTLLRKFQAGPQADARALVVLTVEEPEAVVAEAA